MRVGVIGLNEVSLANIAVLANFGHTLIGYDYNESTIDLLNKGLFNINNKQIKELLYSNKKYIKYTSHASDLANVEVLMFLDDIIDKNSYDEFIKDIVNISSFIAQNCVFLFKNKMPIGTSNKIEKFFTKINNRNIHIAYQAEISFPKTILENIVSPTCLVIGTSSKDAHIIINFLYENYLKRNIFIYFTSLKSAEFVNIALRQYLVLKNSYLYEINNICQKLSINENEFIDYFNKLLENDKYLNSNLGIDGPSFNVDLINQQLPKMAKSKIGNYSKEIKNDFINNLVNNVKSRFNNVTTNLCVGVIGLSNAENNYDATESIATSLANRLLNNNFIVYCYDDKACSSFKEQMISNYKLRYVLTLKKLLRKVDCIIVLKPLKEVLNLDEKTIVTNMPRTKVIFDPYNIMYDKFFVEVEYYSSFGLKANVYED